MDAETPHYTPEKEVDFDMIIEVSEPRGYVPPVGATVVSGEMGFNAVVEYVAPFDDVLVATRVAEGGLVWLDGLRVGHRIRRKFCSADADGGPTKY